jgi:uncharacterized protein YigA (DUF484 family)
LGEQKRFFSSLAFEGKNKLLKKRRNEREKAVVKEMKALPQAVRKKIRRQVKPKKRKALSYLRAILRKSRSARRIAGKFPTKVPRQFVLTQVAILLLRKKSVAVKKGVRRAVIRNLRRLRSSVLGRRNEMTALRSNKILKRGLAKELSKHVQDEISKIKKTGKTNRRNLYKKQYLTKAISKKKKNRQIRQFVRKLARRAVVRQIASERLNKIQSLPGLYGVKGIKLNFRAVYKKPSFFGRKKAKKLFRLGRTAAYLNFINRLNKEERHLA